MKNCRSERTKSTRWSAYVHSIARSIEEHAEDRMAGSLLGSNQDDRELPLLLSLPDIILFSIISFAAAPTHRASFVCTRLALLSRSSYRSLYNNNILWLAILQEDYGALREEDAHKNSQSCDGSKRRRCSRLAKSPLDQVKEAHRLVKDNTEIAFYYLSELVNATSRKSGLSHKRLLSLLHEYGPHLRINQRTSTGGLFLVEVCRSKSATESNMLRCVQELVENHGAMVNLQTFEAAAVYQTAISVAAVRGMASIVQYLLQRGASPSILSSGRFRLSHNPKKTIRYNNLDALGFAKAAKQAELEHGAHLRDVRDLTLCIELLEVAKSA